MTSPFGKVGTKKMRNVAIGAAYYLYTALVSHVPFHVVRLYYLRTLLRLEVGQDSTVHTGCFLTGRAIRIGRNTVINRGCYLDGRGGLWIGDNVSISPQVHLISLGHDPQSADFAPVPKPVRIEDRCWLGLRALVLPGVCIHEGAVVGAGSVVTRDVPAYTIVAGNPARNIGERNRNLTYTLKYRPLLDGDVQ